MTDATPSEKKSFMRILSSLAWADGILKDEELEVLHLTASDIQVALTERDLADRDLDALARKITNPILQARLLDELRTLAEADDHIAPEELSVIKFFAEQFKLNPPIMAGVDWDQVSPPFDDSSLG